MRIAIYLLCLINLTEGANQDWQKAFTLAISSWKAQVKKGIHLIAYGSSFCEVFESDSILEYSATKKFRVYSWKRYLSESEKYYSHILYSLEEKKEEGELQVSIDMPELAVIDAAFRDFDYKPIMLIREDTLNAIPTYVIRVKDLSINREAWVWISYKGDILKVWERNKRIWFKKMRNFTVPAKLESEWVVQEPPKTERQVKLRINFEEYRVWSQVNP